MITIPVFNWPQIPASWELTAAPRARITPAPLLLLWATCGLLLVAAHYQIWGRLNIAYKVLSFSAVAMMPFIPGFTRFLTRKVTIGFLVFLFVVVANGLAGRYLTSNDLYTTYNPAAILVRSLPLMLCGYTLAHYPVHEKRFFFGITAIYAILAIPDAIGFNTASTLGLNRLDQATYRYEVASKQLGKDLLQTFIYFSPLLIFLSATLTRLYGNVSRSQFGLLFFCQAIFLYVALFSGFSAAIVLSVIFVALVTLLAPARKWSTRFAWLAVGLSTIFAIDTLRTGFSDSPRNAAVGTAFLKISHLLEASSSISVTDRLDTTTSGRYSLFLQSLETFRRNPFFGHGLDTVSDPAIGGHSFFIDTAAIFGLFGLVPIAFAFVLLFFGLAKSPWSKLYDWRLASSLIVMTLLCIGNVLNPYLLNMVSLSFFEFLALGLCLADLERVSLSNEYSPGKAGSRTRRGQASLPYGSKYSVVSVAAGIKQ